MMSVVSRLGVEEIGIRRLMASIASMFVHFGLLILLVICVAEAVGSVITLSYHFIKRLDVVLVGVLAVTLILSGAVAFWASKAIIAQLRHLFFEPQENRGIVGNKGDSDNFTVKKGSRAETGTPACAGASSTRRPRSPFLRNSKAVAGLWMAAAFLSSLSVAVAVLSATGTDEHGLSLALRLTGRLSFLFFWPAYAGSAMAAEFGPRFGILGRHGREFGLAFASAQLVHFVLVLWIIWGSDRPISESVMPFFAVGIVWTYVLASSSTERFYNVFGPNLWRMLRTVGLEYIALVFFTDFVILPVQSQAVEHPMAYLPFSILIIVGPLLRWWRSLDPRRLLGAVRSATTSCSPRTRIPSGSTRARLEPP